MKSRLLRVVVLSASVFALMSLGMSIAVSAQSKPEKPDPAADNGKKNQRPVPLTPEEQKKLDDAKKQAEEEKNAIVDPNIEKISTNIVNVDAVVINKKTGAIITGLRKENFAIFEDGVKQNISSFSTPDMPITVSLVLEYSKWTEMLGRANGGVFEPGVDETIIPVAQFLTQFIKPPNDYASVIAFDMRPTPITDFTNDPARIRETINVLLRNTPAFRENNLWDALKFTLIGGTGDTVVLDDSKAKSATYSGMVDVKAKRKAIILVASGIDTFSRTRYDQIRRIIQESDVPIYVISTGNMFFKKYEDQLPEMDTISGAPGRMTFLQATNAMNTIANESGGRHFPMTFEAEIPSILQTINALLRNQYCLSYDIGEPKPPGTKVKIDVKVDVDGDGVFDDQFIVQHRPYYITPGGNKDTDKENKKKEKEATDKKDN